MGWTLYPSFTCATYPPLNLCPPAALRLSAAQLDPSCLVQSERLLELEQGEWEGAVRRECYTPELTARFAADPWVGAACHAGLHLWLPDGVGVRALQQARVAADHCAALAAVCWVLAGRCSSRHVGRRQTCTRPAAVALPSRQPGCASPAW